MTGTVVVRLVRPFGDAEGALAQLHLETRIGVVASSGVMLCALASPEVALAKQGSTATSPPGISNTRHVPWVVAAVFVIGILSALATMR